MIQPFCNLVEQRVIDDVLHLTIQSRATIDSVDDVLGVMTDNSVYRHMGIDLATGDVSYSYSGPIGL